MRKYGTRQQTLDAWNDDIRAKFKVKRGIDPTVDIFAKDSLRNKLLSKHTRTYEPQAMNARVTAAQGTGKLGVNKVAQRAWSNE